MKKVECLIRPEKLGDVKEALSRYGIRGMVVSNVQGCGLQGGKEEVYRGQRYVVDLLPKIKVEIVIQDDWVKDVVDLVCDAAHTGKIGDGKVFVYPVQEVIRIRTGERDEEAL